MNAYKVVEVVAALSTIGLPRAVAWYTAMFGSKHYSKRALRLLRRPPVERTDSRRVNRRHHKLVELASIREALAALGACGLRGICE